MSIDKNHSEQFGRYLQGQMSPAEAHAFEREVLDDPFAQEALEGFESHGSTSFEDLRLLRDRISVKKKKSIPFMKVAAVVALLIIGSFSVYQFASDIEGEQLAIEEEPVEKLIQNSPEPDTISAPRIQEVDLIEESTLAEEIDPKKFNQDGLKVADNNDEVAELAIEEESKEELIVEDISEEIIAEVEETKLPEILNSEPDDNESISDMLQGRVAGIEVQTSDKAPTVIPVDSLGVGNSKVMPQPFVADETSRLNSRLKKVEASSRSASTDEIISGIVTNDTGEALPGVNVVIKGTTTGVTTDLDGSYSLPKKGNMTLVYSYVGFETHEVEVGDRDTIDLVLGETMELQEVVVSGYEQTDELNPGYSPARLVTGNSAFKKYLKDNLRYPEAAKDNEIEGTVILELTINPNGQVAEIDIKKSLGYGCDQEAIRLVKDGPAWEAAEKNGDKVEDKLKVKVKFKMD